jgi:hypothetical protein
VAVATVQVDLARDWLDYITLAATLFAALGTVSAVGWAIYGPSWKQRHRQPILTLSSRREGNSFLYSPKEPEVSDGSYLRLHNAHGRHSAEGVEVFLTVYGAAGW